jgi:cytidine deaminase
MTDQLIEKAIQMRGKAMAPYSNYKVGSAVLTESGKIFGGCNVESSSYGLTCCAERIALYNAISNGYTKFTALAVATKNGGNPCGACRQVIWDLCGEISIYITDISGNIKKRTSSELLPNAFDKNSL